MLNAKIMNAKARSLRKQKEGKVTVATNMAGRGVDIKLGGVFATPEEYEEVKSLGDSRSSVRAA